MAAESAPSRPAAYSWHVIRRDGRAVDCVGLENRKARKGLGGSNPSLSANYKYPRPQVGGFFVLAGLGCAAGGICNWRKDRVLTPPPAGTRSGCGGTWPRRWPLFGRPRGSNPSLSAKIKHPRPHRLGVFFCDASLVRTGVFYFGEKIGYSPHRPRGRGRAPAARGHAGGHSSAVLAV